MLRDLAVLHVVCRQPPSLQVRNTNGESSCSSRSKFDRKLTQVKCWRGVVLVRPDEKAGFSKNGFRPSRVAAFDDLGSKRQSVGGYLI